MAMATIDANEIRKVKNAVCKIECEAANGDQHEGTAFHYGNGWIMTNAHNFQDKKEAKSSQHNIFENGSATVIFDIEKENGEQKAHKFDMDFKNTKRIAFIHHLKPGKYADIDKDKDIAMFKLGKQYDYGGRDGEQWEKDEQKKLDNMDSSQFALAKVQPPQPNVQDHVYTAHYGGDEPGKKWGELEIVEITPATTTTVPLLHLQGVLPNQLPLPRGSSGCPIMSLGKDGKLYLAGLNFSGNGGQSHALQWPQGIQKYIQAGVGIIVEIGSYFAYTQMALQERAQEARESLQEKANKNKLTIYLMDGDIIIGV